jgi:arginyl-tRNA synthetase
MNITRLLQSRLGTALAGIVPSVDEYAALVKPSANPAHGDYQANCAMPLAKVLGKKPPEIAALIVSKLDVADICEPPTVAGPGFINLKLRADWLARQLKEIGSDDRLGVDLAEKPKTVVIDYSSPNVAKPLHVGHLRSTIIGDALKRLLAFLGHRMISDNHLGDWGQQFGILIYGYKNHLNRAAYEADPVHELARLYVEIRKGFKSDEDDEAGHDPIQCACRAETAKLHAGDPENNEIWREIMPYCLAELNAIYARLGISFDHTLGESYYQPVLADVVADLHARGLAVETDGALGIFLSDNPDTPPALVQKTDGAFTYTTTDLATIKYRVEHFKADEILYVVDSRQALHFKNLFEAARRWGFDSVPLTHIGFGTVQGPDGKPFGMRKGGVPLLEALLDEAVAAARAVFVQSINDRLANGHEVPEFAGDEECQVHQAVGMGAVKYADLSQNRLSDYRFSPEKMTDTSGNTATYMQYAFARNRSIFRRGGIDPASFRTSPPLPVIGTPDERALALQLLRFPEALAAAAADFRPNLITAYLWDLATAYSGFFTNCPVLKAETPELKLGRLLLCDLTARIIQKGLGLLGIQTVERM